MINVTVPWLLIQRKVKIDPVMNSGSSIQTLNLNSGFQLANELSQLLSIDRVGRVLAVVQVKWPIQPDGPLKVSKG